MSRRHNHTRNRRDARIAQKIKNARVEFFFANHVLHGLDGDARREAIARQSHTAPSLRAKKLFYARVQKLDVDGVESMLKEMSYNELAQATMILESMDREIELSQPDAYSTIFMMLYDECDAIIPAANNDY